MMTNPLKHNAAGVRPGTPAAGVEKRASAGFSLKSIVHPSVKSGGIPIEDNGRVVGYLRGTILHRKMVGSRHILTNPPSIALGIDPLNKAIQLSAETIWIQDTETGLEYRTDIWNFKNKAILINRGFGDQMALPLVYWRVTDPRHPEDQLGLFEGLRP
jgi:hypothetical protein